MFKYTVYLSTWPCLMRFVVCTKPPLWNWKSFNGCHLSRKIVMQVQDFVTKCCKNRTQPISDKTVSFSGWNDPTPHRSNAFPFACSTSVVLSCLVFSSFCLCLLLCFVSFLPCPVCLVMSRPSGLLSLLELQSGEKMPHGTNGARINKRSRI